MHQIAHFFQKIAGGACLRPPNKLTVFFVVVEQLYYFQAIFPLQFN